MNSDQHTSQLTESSVNSTQRRAPWTRRRWPGGLAGALTVAVLLAVVAILWGPPSTGQPIQDDDSVSGRAIPVQTVPAGSAAVHSQGQVLDGAGGPSEAAMLQASGTLRPSRVAPLSFAVSGVVAALLADEGEEVRRNATLARLDAVPFRATLAQLEARASFLESRLERSEALAASGAISPEELDQDRAELEAIRAQAEAARWNLRQAELRAPFSGSVRARDIELGQVVSPSLSAFELIATDTLEAEVSLPARDLARIDRGKPITVTSPDRPDFQISGTLSHWPVSGDPRSGSVPLVIMVPNTDRHLLSGMVVHCALPIRDVDERAVGIVVPLSAIRMEQDGAAVFRVEDSVARRCAVQVGTIRSDRVIVQGELHPGDAIIVEPPDRLRDGDAVDAYNLTSRNNTES